ELHVTADAADATCGPGKRAQVERFVADYVAAFNRALQGAPDFDSIRAAFAPCFVSAGAQGVSCGLNDDRFGANLEQGFAYYRSIGMRDVEARALALTAIDADHQLARVSYRSRYRRDPGKRPAGLK